MDDASPRSSASKDPLAAYEKHRRLVLLGQVLMAVGVLVAVVHLVLHLVTSPSGFMDLAAGYPAAGAIFLAGAMLAGRSDPGTR
ncbi:MAG: hypothetical protein ABIQ61_09075 [Ornithinibacter sp.]